MASRMRLDPVRVVGEQGGVQMNKEGLGYMVWDVEWMRWDRGSYY